VILKATTFGDRILLPGRKQDYSLTETYHRTEKIDIEQALNYLEVYQIGLTTWIIRCEKRSDPIIFIRLA
jgi:hypothetical protein